MISIYILLGGNIGDKKRIFSEVYDRLAQQIGKISAQSAIYETEPWGFESDDLFWNQVLEISCELLPEEVLKKTQQIEIELGRIRKKNQYDSRIIDIDILFYGNQIIELKNLVIPHQRIQERNFVLVPMNEIASDFIHPVFQKSISQMLSECTDQLKVEKIKG